MPSRPIQMAPLPLRGIFGDPHADHHATGRSKNDPRLMRPPAWGAGMTGASGWCEICPMARCAFTCVSRCGGCQRCDGVKRSGRGFWPATPSTRGVLLTMSVVPAARPQSRTSLKSCTLTGMPSKNWTAVHARAAGACQKFTSLGYFGRVFRATASGGGSSTAQH